MQVGFRQAKHLGQRTISSADTERRAVGAVGGTPGPARLAGAAHGIDLTYDAASYQGLVAGLLHNADELVAQDPSKVGISAGDLQVGVADADQDRPDPRLAGWWFWTGVIGIQPELAVNDECSHLYCAVTAVLTAAIHKP
jgi:hypothetical protein